MTAQLDPDGTLTPLDLEAATQPSFSRTWCIALFRSLFYRIRGSFKDVQGEHENEDENIFGGDDGSSIDASASDSPGSGASTPKRNGPSVPVALKAGGRRKVQARKRQQK